MIVLSRSLPPSSSSLDGDFAALPHAEDDAAESALDEVQGGAGGSSEYSMEFCYPIW